MHDAADFVIAGGGVAGAAAAALLARLGQRIQLVERAAGSQHKVCGEFVSAEALGYLHALGVDPWQLGAIPLGKVRLAANTLIAEAPLPFAAASLSRSILDAALLRRAQECGAQIITGKQVERLARTADGWQMVLNDGSEVNGKQAMLATGKHDLRGHARGPGVQSGLVAFKLYLRLSAEQARQLEGAVEVILFPGGYLGLQLVGGGMANLCMLIRSEALQRLGGGWPGVFEHVTACSRYLRERLRGAEECFARPLALAQIPYGYVCQATEPGLWLVGDQAAVIPSFSGDGISIALHSAYCAAAMQAAGRDAMECVRQMRRDVQGQVARATRLSRLMVEKPRLADLLRYFPALLPYFAQSTRIAEARLLKELSQRRVAA